MTRQNATDRKDVWQTPDELLDIIDEEITVDPCAAPNTSIGAINYTEEDDGLAQEWEGVVFVNPPFTEKAAFLEKVIEQQDNTDCIYVVTPDSTDVISWWHKYIAPHADYVWFSEGRISYLDPDTREEGKGATFGTAVSVFGEPSDQTLRNMMDAGHLVETVRQL